MAISPHPNGRTQTAELKPSSAVFFRKWLPPFGPPPQSGCASTSLCHAPTPPQSCPNTQTETTGPSAALGARGTTHAPPAQARKPTSPPQPAPNGPQSPPACAPWDGGAAARPMSGCSPTTRHPPVARKNRADHRHGSPTRQTPPAAAPTHSAARTKNLAVSWPAIYTVRHNPWQAVQAKKLLTFLALASVFKQFVAITLIV